MQKQKNSKGGMAELKRHKNMKERCKMADVNQTISITLNMDGLNSPIKSKVNITRLDFKKHDPTTCFL